MNFKNTKEAHRELEQDGIFIDNNLYQGYEDRHLNKSYISINNKLQEIDFRAEGFERVQTGTVFFESDNTTMSLDSLSGFLYQKSSVKDSRLKLMFPDEDCIIEKNGKILFKDKIYAVDKNNKIEEISEDFFNSLSMYYKDTPENEILMHKNFSKIEGINKHREEEANYKKEMTLKSSIPLVMLKKEQKLKI